MAKQLSESIDAALAGVELDDVRLLEVASRLIEAYDGAVYGFDLLTNAAMNRALALSSGFCALIREQNLICAAALLRLQLDTALRVYAGFIVENPHQFALAILEGAHVRKMKDRSGNFMTDRYLVTMLADEYPWVESVYEKTSGYVHLSSTHFMSTVENVADGDRTINIKIGANDKTFPDSIYLDTITAFRGSTEILAKHLYGWLVTKSDPETVIALKSKRRSQ